MDRMIPHRSVRTFLLLPLVSFFVGRWGHGQENNSSLIRRSQTKIVTAIPTEEKIEIDGELKEATWQKASPGADFIQNEPYPGKPSTEKTEVRVLYDADNLYVGALCFDSEPGKLKISDLKRDFEIEETDVFGLILDTFHDRRNGFAFFTNPMGAKRELQSIDDGRDLNLNWEGIWYVKTKLYDYGWAVEIAIPFKTLRFNKDHTQIWGTNFLRRVRRKNETAHWSPVPLRYQMRHVSYAGELHGLGEIRQGRNLKVKPFAVAELNQLSLTKKGSTSVDFDGGIDLKYGVTPGLTLDVTANTDFSQVEVDEQQVNLTRFPLFFPEKREFFLENAGLFQFGEVAKAAGPPRDPELILFFSRRIGLSPEGEVVPIWGGTRLTGRSGKFGLGFLNIQTKEMGKIPAHNFTVGRVKREIFSKSDVGVIFINRHSEFSPQRHRALGLDANFRLFENLRINSFIAKTDTPGASGSDLAGKIAVDWTDRRIDFYASYLDVEDNFKAEVGHVRRTGMRLSQLEWGYHHRPRKHPLFRDIIVFKGVFEYTTDQHNRPLTKLFRPIFRIWFHNGGVFEITARKNFDRLDRPFFIRPQVAIPAGDYGFTDLLLIGNTDKSKALSADVRFSKGNFYDGKKTSLNLASTWRPSYKFSAALRYERNDVSLPHGSFITNLVGLRLNYAFSTRLFLNAFLQYSSERKRMSSNIRLNLIHRPMSDFFIVYNEQRDVTSQGLSDKGLIFKYTHLLDF
ncbi:MAG: carbohydrate binding family 9 domain-containing protein [Acidobacteria bacterium]|nr:carbohydrate binding family 9 domain-containing protein [Acidobacteriota bacterium]